MVKKNLFKRMDRIEDIIQNGFHGGQTIARLIEMGIASIPSQQGVYLIVRDTPEPHAFLPIGTGGHFKGKDPNVPIEELESNWVDNTQIVYIGKATNLNKRLQQYLRFGQGANVGHWGGRYIWQLKDAVTLSVFWKETTEDPRAVEQKMISDFKTRHGRKRPFANLKD